MVDQYCSHHLPRRADGRMYAKHLRKGYAEIYEPKGKDLVWKTIAICSSYAAWGINRAKRAGLLSIRHKSLSAVRAEIDRITLEINNAL